MAPSLQPYDYRIRVQLKVKGKAIGYYQERSHKIVDIDHCPISHPLVNQIIRNTSRGISHLVTHERDRDQCISRRRERSLYYFILIHMINGSKYVVKKFLQSQPILKGIAITKGDGLRLFGDPTLNFLIPLGQEGEKRNLKFRISPGSFFQVNLGQNQTLIQTVLQFAEVNKEEKVLDLYAGIGNLTLPLALGAKEVLGIEENEMAIVDGRFNAETNRIINCDFIHGRVEDVLMSWERKRPDLVVLDPPRTGCKTILDQVAELKPKKIIYVSCEPTTFSRDLRLLSESGYTLQKLALIDMFPQTYHMEVVGLLQQS